MTEHTQDIKEYTDRQRKQKREFHSYVWGIGLALLLTFASFGLVYWDVLTTGWMYIALGAFALAQMIVHFRFFLHLGLKRKREDLQVMMFTAVLLFMMVAGTIWIMTSLADRMLAAIMN